MNQVRHVIRLLGAIGARDALGFAFLEVGTVRHKNQVNALMKIIDFSISTIAYFFVGYAVAYGELLGAVISVNNGYELVKFFFLLTFAAAIPAIISGGIAERARFYPQLFASAHRWVVYPLFEGITWNGNFGVQEMLEATLARPSMILQVRLSSTRSAAGSPWRRLSC